MGIRAWVYAGVLAMPWLPAPAAIAASAQEAAGAQTSAISPAARAVIDRMSAYLRGLQRFEVAARETRDEVLAYGYKLEHQQASTMVVQRPDRLRVEVAGDLKTRTYVFDGKSLAIHAPEHGVYARMPAPATLGALINALHDRGIELPLIDVLAEAVNGTLTEGVLIGRRVGDSHVDGVAVDHLAFRQATIDWQLWVEQGERPLPRKLVITARYAAGEPQYSAVLDWNLAPRIDDRTFVFEPPAGARAVGFLGADDATGGQP